MPCVTYEWITFDTTHHINEPITFMHLQNKCTQYWPEKMNARLHRDIVINNVEEKEYEFYVIRKLTVSLKKVGALCNISYGIAFLYNVLYRLIISALSKLSSGILLSSLSVRPSVRPSEECLVTWSLTTY